MRSIFKALHALRRPMGRLALFGGLMVCAIAPTAPALGFGGSLVAQSENVPRTNASLVVLMRDGSRTVESIQLSYQGKPEPVALIIPVPGVVHPEAVRTLPKQVVERADAFSAPRLIERAERNPCGAWRRYGPWYEASFGGPAQDRKLDLSSTFADSAYEIDVLEADALEPWLREHQYRVPAELAAQLQEHVSRQNLFLVARIDPTRHGYQHGRALLPALRFEYTTRDFSLPVRVGRSNLTAQHDLTLLVFGPTRYVVSNRPQITIPTQLELRDRGAEQFAQFYEALFTRIRESTPEAVVTTHARTPWWTCEFCPGVQFTDGDFATLGADSMAFEHKLHLDRYTLTRLQHRYGPDDATSDLSLEPGPALRGPTRILEIGGKRVSSIPKGEFEAAYANNTRWSGPVECADPARGIWDSRDGRDSNDGKPLTTAAARAALVDPVNLDELLERPLQKDASTPKAGSSARSGVRKHK